MKEKSVKTKWITFILYPDNRYHMQYLEWIKKNEIGFYIQHDADDEGQANDDKETKTHIHVATYRNVQRTSSAFVKNMPSVDYFVEEWEIDGDSKRPKKLSCIIPNDAKKEDIITRPLVSSSQNVRDIYALAHYFIHDTFKCDYLGKKKYEKGDVEMLNNGRKVFDDCFTEENNCSTSDYLSKVINVCKICDTRNEVVSKIALIGDEKLTKWFIHNSQFVLNWIFNDDVKGGVKND